MELIRIAHHRPGFFRDLRNGNRVQRAKVAGELGRQASAHLHRSRPAFFQRRVIQIGIGIGVQDLVTEGRGRWGIHCKAPDLSPFNPPQQGRQPVHVHRLGQTVTNGLLDQRVNRHGHLSLLVLPAGQRAGKDGGQQVLRAHPLDLRRDPAPVDEPEQRQRACGIPPPATGKHRCSQDGLDQHFADGVGTEKPEDRLQREAVPLSQRDHDPLVRGRGL